MTRKKWFLLALVLLLVLAAGAVGGQVWLNRRARESVDEQLTRLAPLARVEYGTLWYGAFSRALTFRDLSITPPGFTRPFGVRRLEIREQDGRRTVVVSGIAAGLDQPALDRVRPALAALGYGDLTASARLDWRYSAPEGRLDLESFRLRVEDMGVLDLSLDLSDLRWPGGQFNLAGLLQLRSIVGRGILNRASLGYEDLSLIRRMDESAAQSQNTTVEALRDKRAWSVRVHAVPGMSRQAEDALEAFARFARNPQKILILMKPENPAPLLETNRIRDFGQWVKIMGVTVESGE
ncbi:MAG: hypothetical protein KKA60_12500 [Proteobacteria bacterium]|nr:hypothetical protein [Pseudomonadota bacterium]